MAATSLNRQHIQLAQRCGALGVRLLAADGDGRAWVVDSDSGLLMDANLAAGGLPWSQLACDAAAQFAAHAQDDPASHARKAGPFTLWSPCPGLTFIALNDPTRADDSGAVKDDAGRWLIAVHIGVPERAGARSAPLADVGLDLATLPRTRIGIRELVQVLSWTLADLAERDHDRDAIDAFSDSLTQAYEHMTMLFRLAEAIASADSPAAVVSDLISQMHAVLPFRWIILRFADDARGVPDLSGQTISAGQIPSLNRDIHNAMLSAIDDAELAQRGFRILDPGGCRLANLLGAAGLAVPVYHDRKTVGLLVAGGKSGQDTDVASNEMQFLDATARFIGVYHVNAARFQQQHDLFLGSLHALTASIDAKDPYTCGHSERVSLLGGMLASALDMPPAEVRQVHIAGLVHDVGKIGIPEAVLCKNGRLTDEEYDIIKRHPRIGYDILKDIEPMRPLLPGVLHHHERWDGRGYPAGLIEQAIPLYGRLLAVPDTFDAMSSSRSYRPALPREKVLEEIRRCAGSQFDPEIAAAFLELDLSPYDEMIEQHRSLKSFAA